MSGNTEQQSKFFYGWIVVIACCLIGMSAAAQLTYGIYVKELTREFNWNRTLVSSIASFNNLVYSLAAVASGVLADRYRLRPFIWVSALLLGGGLFLCGYAQNVLHFYLFFGIIVALGMGCCYSVPSSVVQRWFIEKRGIALGISMCGIGLGSFVISLLIGYLIPLYGWRASFMAEGALLFSFMIIAGFFIVGNPMDKGVQPYGAGNENLKNNEINIASENTWTIIRLLNNKSFLCLYVSQLLTCISLLIVHTHVVPHAEDMGIPKLIAAGVLGVIGVFSALGRLQAGYVCDKIGFKKAFIIFCGICCAACLYLIVIKNVWMLYSFVVVYSLGWGGKAMALPGLAGDTFGTNSLGMIMGLISTAYGLGGFIGSILGGWIFDITQSYVLAFVAAVFFYLLAIMSVYLVRPEVEVKA